MDNLTSYYTYTPNNQVHISPYNAGEMSIGWDISLIQEETILPHDKLWIKTGLIIRPPFGFYFEVFPRSSITKYPGLFLQNSIGVIDRDFVGMQDEIQIRLFNVSDNTYTFQKETRLVQLILRQHIRTEFKELPYEQLESRSRNGFGSTGQ